MNILQKLDDKFNKVFAKTFADLNLNVNKINKQGTQSNYYFEAPVVSLGDGGCTVVNNTDTSIIKLAPAAKVMCDFKKVLPYVAIYRISFSEDDAAKAADSDPYFNYVFVPVINEAIRRYIATFGSPEEIRFGTYFCTATRPGPSSEIFIQADNGDVEFRLFGEWASNKPLEEATNEQGKD